jgi:hypothetical protein
LTWKSPGQLDRPQAVRPPLLEKTARGSNPNFLAPDLPNHSTDCSETSAIAGLPPGQPLPQRNRPESLTIKRNRRNRISRSRTRPTQKNTKSSPIEDRFGGKVTSQRGTRSPYVTHQRPQEIVLKTPPTKSSENQHKRGRENHLVEQRRTIYTYRERFVQGLACHPNIHPSL